MMQAKGFRMWGVGMLMLGLALAARAEGEKAEWKAIPLPQPTLKGGMPLMEALSARQSTKAFGAKAVTTETLANLLWAAYGVNRPATGGRTVPSGVKSYEIDIYVFLKQGVFVYDPLAHALKPVAAGDMRGLTGASAATKDAAVHLVYIADHARQPKTAAEKKSIYSAAHTGFIGQNVYLYCASAGLGTVYHEMGDRKRLGEALKLRAEQEIMFAQTVGYPKRESGE